MSTVKATNFQHPSATDPAIELDAAGKLWLAGTKVLQIVRATDTTQRTTTSASFSDVTGMSVTITPQKSTSAILIIATFLILANRSLTGGGQNGRIIMTDSSNNAVSGTERGDFGINVVATSVNPTSPLTLIGYATPATTSATTYKLRFLSNSADTTLTVRNDLQTGQLFAIEVSA